MLQIYSENINTSVTLVDLVGCLDFKLFDELLEIWVLVHWHVVLERARKAGTMSKERSVRIGNGEVMTQLHKAVELVWT